MIPDNLTEIYPNPIYYLCGKPILVFRDHRWILPIISLAGTEGLLKLPVTVITFDRHRDSLSPLKGKKMLSDFRINKGTFEELIHIVTNILSPRDDDWIESGMELGLISDVVQFISEKTEVKSLEPISFYKDSSSEVHRIFHLGSPREELTYKGALADTSSEYVSEGLWETLGWKPSKPGLTVTEKNFIFDIDLDFFTYTWGEYVFAFTEEIYEGEFLTPCQSMFYEEYSPLNFIKELVSKAKLLSIACEPAFCGDQKKAENILNDVNNLFLEKELITEKINVDYKTVYPDK